jgi:hypothetical protein
MGGIATTVAVLTEIPTATGRLVPSREDVRFLREASARLWSLLTELSVLQRWLMDLSRCA